MMEVTDNRSSKNNTSVGFKSNNDVIVELNYVKDTGSRPKFYTIPPTPGGKGFQGTYDHCKVHLRDARGNSDLTLDAASFQFVDHKTALSKEDFYKIDKYVDEEPNEVLKEAYFQEIEDLVKKTTGAEEAIVFDHVVRNNKKTGPSGGYASSIHVDFAASKCKRQFKELVGKLNDDKYKKGRFVTMNAWRNIAETPIHQNPLAVCDSRTIVMPDDVIASDFIPPNPNNRFEQYRLASRNGRKHGWYYLSQMTRDEVLLFKQYDSDTIQGGRTCFHTAVSLPDVPSDLPPRESIEVRMIAFFPDYKPNTCPDLDEISEIGGGVPLRNNDDSESPEKIANHIVSSLQNANNLPLLAQAIYRWIVRSNSGAERFLDLMLRDRGGRFGLKGADMAKKQAVKDIVMDTDTFCDDMMAAKKKLDRMNHDRRKASPWTLWF
ncbi:hypothetical protein ACHAWF_005430 [Thalassiosira exigua]